MKWSQYFLCLVAMLCKSQAMILQNGNVTLSFNITSDDGIFLELIQSDTVKLSGHIGAGLKLQQTKNSQHFVSEDGIQFSFSEAVEGFTVLWETTNTSAKFQDCFNLNDFQWFAGRLGNTAEWPIQNSKIEESPFIITEDSPISEPYWLSSNGSFIFVNETTPLFIDLNNLHENTLCLIAQNANPYVGRTRVLLNYTIAANDNATQAYKNAADNFLGRLSDQLDTAMIREPVWSTWAKYQNDINDQLLLDFAQSIHSNSFRGQVQIEDGWEDCLGSLTFKKLDLANINKTIIEISTFSLRVTLWVHPYISPECEVFTEADDKKYLVKDADGNNLIVKTQNNSSYLIDLTNENAKEWYTERVGALVDKHMLNGFKFVGGELSWFPESGALFKGEPEKEPNEFTELYGSISNFTKYVSVESGWRTQWVPVFVSLPEKEPNWSLENGLKSVLINVFQLNLAGYPAVLPGLIGGKTLDRPSPELYIRWTQLVTFMPVMQFGYLPWEIIGNKYDVLQIVTKFIDLHSWFSDGISNILKKNKSMGLPVNTPIWWVDSSNPDAFKILDQYMLGENIMIAPILDEGVTSRDIYLPPGQWRDGNNDTIYDGSTTLKKYPAPIDVLPYFQRIQ